MQINVNNSKKCEIIKKTQNFRAKYAEIPTLYQENIICEEGFVLQNQKTKKFNK